MFKEATVYLGPRASQKRRRVEKESQRTNESPLIVGDEMDGYIFIRG